MTQGAAYIQHSPIHILHLFSIPSTSTPEKVKQSNDKKKQQWHDDAR